MKKFLVSVVMIFVMLCGFIACNDNGDPKRYLFDSNNPKITSDMKSGKDIEIVDFAQISDVHIADVDNPLRFSNLKMLADADPTKFPTLGTVLGLIPAANRAVAPYTEDILYSTIDSINASNSTDILDFVMDSGDNSDTSLKQEYQRAVDILDDNFNMRWYMTIGNHDVEYMGSFNTDGLISAIVEDNAQDINWDELTSLQSNIDILKISTFHEFAVKMQINGHGNYSFDPKPFVHCIVLHTTEIDCPEVPVENFALGVMTRAQHQWLLNEIDKNKNKFCLIFAHHPIGTFFPTTEYNKYVASGKEIEDSLKARKNVIAWVCGNDHKNRILAKNTSSGWGFWEITTSALADYPSEWRKLTIRDSGKGIGVIQTKTTRHADIFVNGKNLLDIQRDESINPSAAKGEQGDRDVQLFFKISPDVAKYIKTK